jgi:hypothetical protein
MFAKVKGKCHAGKHLFSIEHSARLEKDSFGMTSKLGLAPLPIIGAKLNNPWQND